MNTRRAFVALFAGIVLTPVAMSRAFAQETEEEKKLDRLSGRVQMVDKDKSTIWLRVGNTTRYVVYDSSTKFTARNKPGSFDEVKDNVRVICLGKFDDKGRLMATRVDVRGN